MLTSPNHLDTHTPRTRHTSTPLIISVGFIAIYYFYQFVHRRSASTSIVHWHDMILLVIFHMARLKFKSLSRAGFNGENCVLRSALRFCHFFSAARVYMCVVNSIYLRAWLPPNKFIIALMDQGHNSLFKLSSAKNLIQTDTHTHTHINPSQTKLLIVMQIGPVQTAIRHVVDIIESSKNAWNMLCARCAPFFHIPCCSGVCVLN